MGDVYDDRDGYPGRPRSRTGSRTPPIATATSAVSSNTSLEDPRDLAARVFIGNIPVDKVTRSDIEAVFSKYGPLKGVSVHKGFAFVQFERPEDAHESVYNEIGREIAGNTLDVKMAIEGRKDPQLAQSDAGKLLTEDSHWSVGGRRRSAT